MPITIQFFYLGIRYLSFTFEITPITFHVVLTLIDNAPPTIDFGSFYIDFSPSLIDIASMTFDDTPLLIDHHSISSDCLLSINNKFLSSIKTVPIITNWPTF